MTHDIKKEIAQIKKQFKVQYDNRDYQAVIDGAKKVLAMDSIDYDTMCTAATACMEICNHEEALLFATRMLEVKKDYIYGHIVLAKIHYLRLEYNKTIEVLQNLFLQYEKQMPNMIKQLAYSLLGNIYNVMGEPKKSCQSFLQASKVAEDVNTKIVEYSKYLLSTNYSDDSKEADIFAEHAKYNDLFKKVKQFTHRARVDKEKINIGYISPDFRYHVVVFFCYELLSRYNKKRYNITCYSKGLEDGVTAQLKSLVSEWRDIRKMNPDEAAKVIYQDGIDILVDLSGHTDNNCLQILARKPAPIQVSGIGYFNTTGLKAVDYFLTDKYCDPIGKNDDLFVEKLVRLPHSHLCYTARAEVGKCVAAPINKNGFITFGSFNNFTKVTDATLLLWKSILDNVENSKLVLKSKVFGSKYACQEIKKRFVKLGFDEDRVEFRPASMDYLSQYQDLDIALDTFPYPGGGTTCEALYMGVPVITLSGARHGSRFGYSILKNVGLDDCIAFSETEYVEKAIALADNREKLNELHQILRQKIVSSAVMNGPQYVSEVEICYEEMWEDLMYLNHRGGLNKVLDAKKIAEIDQLKLKLLHAWEDSNNEQVIQLGREVLKINPNDHEILYVLSEIYYNENDFVRAQKFAKRTIAAKDDYVKAYYLLGMIYSLQKDNNLYPEKVITTFEKMFQLNMDSLETEYQSRAYAALSGVYWEIEDIDKCIEYQKKSFDIEPNINRKSSFYSDYLFEMNHSLTFTKEEIFQEHIKYNKLFTDIMPHEHNNIKKKEKLRIGYISPDFRVHPVTYFSLQLLLEYNKEKFEIYCYSSTKKPDEVTERLKTLVTKWQDISNTTYQDAAKLIYEDEIDILVDLSGHTAHTVLPVLAYKPAPIQMSGIGYVNTTGLKTVDYFITDNYCDPEGLNDRYFTEKLLRLPKTHFCYTGNSEAPLCKEAPSNKNGLITFGSFNKFKKVTDKTLALWASILNRVPNSKLVIKAAAFANEYGTKLAKNKLMNSGIKEEQLELRPSSLDYMEQYNDIDIALDTYPCAGGTTTFEALYMGVPVVTLAGEQHVSRFGYSILKNLDFEEGIAYDEAEYVEKAILLAQDKAKLNELHKTLRVRMLNSPLMNGKQYVHDMENAYRKIWDEVVDMKIKKNNRNKINKTNVVSKTDTKEFDINKINQLKQEVLQYKLQGNYEAAKNIISDIFTMEYYGIDVMSELADIYYITDDLERAEVWSKKVISFDKNHAEAYLLLAKVYRKQNAAFELWPILNKLLEKNFDNIKHKVEELLNTIDLSDYQMEIAKNYKNLSQYIAKRREQAIPVASVNEVQLVEKKPQVTKTDLSNLKNLLQGLGLGKKQENTLANMIEDAFENGLTDQTAEKLKVEAIDQVITEISEHSETDHHKVELLNAVAVKFYEYHNLDKVLPILVKALELDGQDNNSLKNLGVLLFNIGEQELALQYLDKVSQKDIAVIDFINRIKGE
ncbi:MAG: repeat-containing protein [Firmicutes bacterium]|nr:repeat-containing protein [Bacillota bacterium]